jgi:hypothetical protein
MVMKIVNLLNYGPPYAITAGKVLVILPAMFGLRGPQQYNSDRNFRAAQYLSVFTMRNSYLKKNKQQMENQSYPSSHKQKQGFDGHSIFKV